MKTGNVLVFIFRWLFIAIGYLLAPLFAMVRGITFHALVFSDKIMGDLYPQKLAVGTPQPDGQMKVMESDCCKAKVLARIEKGEVQFFYCEKCKEEVDANIFHNQSK